MQLALAYAHTCVGRRGSLSHSATLRSLGSPGGLTERNGGSVGWDGAQVVPRPTETAIITSSATTITTATSLHCLTACGLVCLEVNLIVVSRRGSNKTDIQLLLAHPSSMYHDPAFYFLLIDRTFWAPSGRAADEYL